MKFKRERGVRYDFLDAKRIAKHRCVVAVLSSPRVSRMPERRRAHRRAREEAQSRRMERSVTRRRASRRLAERTVR
jgi:hypothetical protein